MLKDILSYGIGTLAALGLAAALLYLFIRDITQKKHSVLRNYPIVGRLRYFFEQLGSTSVAFHMLYPYPELKARMKVA